MNALRRWWPDVLIVVGVTWLAFACSAYAGDGSATPTPGDFSRTKVGDKTDTSPYETDHPVVGISTGTYIENMKVLIGALRQ